MGEGDVVVKRVGSRLVPQRRLEVLKRRRRVVGLGGETAEAEVCRRPGAGQFQGAFILGACFLTLPQLEVDPTEADGRRRIVRLQRAGLLVASNRVLEFSQVLRGAAEEVAPTEVPRLQLRGVGETGSRRWQEVVHEVELAGLAEQQSQLIGVFRSERTRREGVVEKLALLGDLIAHRFVDAAKIDFGDRHEAVGDFGLRPETHGGQRQHQGEGGGYALRIERPDHRLSSFWCPSPRPVPRTSSV